MEILLQAGYRTVDLGTWISAMARHRTLPGKPIILTFDDGYRDFLTAAMPVLRVHDFLATVFLVAERMGGTADWDAGYGEPAPLLSWEEALALQEAGIEFGCHSSLHRPMTGMRLPEMAEDAVRARAILEEGLATSVKTFSYPYGAQNGLVRRVIGDLGFQGAVSCEPGLSRLGNDPLQLPRIEVSGDCTPDRLLASIERFSVPHTAPNGRGFEGRWAVWNEAGRVYGRWAQTGRTGTSALNHLRKLSLTDSGAISAIRFW
jgi:peptidoglycan/xylan/chitin deacetylase (PgdA/CDA1 family)